jgi:septal ring factor EnvC (AmiA/AmiB activator)
MSRSSRYIILLLLLMVVQATAGLAQSKGDLEKQKKQLLKDIEYTNKLLKDTEQNKKKTLNELTLMKAKINQRQQLINTVVSQASLVEKQIGQTRAIVVALEDDLARLKEEYGKMLYYTYKNQSQYDRLMFILSSKDINQAYKRVKYFQQYAKHRQEQVEAISAVQKDLNAKSEELTVKKRELSRLVEDSEREKLQLSAEKEERDKVVHVLQDKEKELRKALKKKEQESKKLEQAIARVIENEIRKQEELRKREELKQQQQGVTVKTPTVTKSGFALTPDELILSKSFSDNRAKLPWPSERGVIVSTFGEHEHPTLRDIKTVNNGVDIATEPGTKARAVFDGTVSAVVAIPGAHKAVILRHGEYLTVYSNIETVEVKMGDKVSVKQSLGTVVTDPEENRTVLHFELWNGATKQNPALWIAKQK